MKLPALRLEIRCAHESHSLLAILPTRRPRAGRRARSGGRTGTGRDCDQGSRAELLRHPDDPGQVPDQAAISVFAGRRGCRRDRKRRRRGHRPQGRRPRGGVLRPQRCARKDRAAGIIIIYGTALHALEDRASPKPGETLAVLGAAGGTGLAACELGKLMGLKVIACASSDEKLEFAKAHGAELTLNYAKEDLKEGLKRLTGGKGVDIVFDPVGGSYAEAALRAIAWEGRFLVIGFAAGDIPKMPLNLALLKGCDIRGVFWGAWTRVNPEKNRANLEKLVRWTAEGKISSHVDRTFPLAQTAEALKVLAGRKAMGKVILHP